jgi:hypothetical protein
MNPFPCSIFEGILDLDNTVTDGIIDYITKISNSVNTDLVSSHYDLPSIHNVNKSFDLFTKTVVETANLYYQEIKNLPFNPKIFDTQRMWFNVYKGYGAMRIHDHAEAPYVGTFYLSESAAPIRFTHPSAFKLNNTYQVYPQKNKLVLWPGWLFHEVPAVPDIKERVSISFKLNFTVPHHGLDGRMFDSEPLDGYTHN